MKPTDEERMEVARRLRDFSEFVYEGRYYHLNGTLLGMGLYATTLESLRVGMCRLADLIEPEPERTCRYVWDEKREAWACSECGGIEPVCDDLSYCIDCGAKVTG